MACRASATLHQPGRMQYCWQTSQAHGSEGGYFSFKLFWRAFVRAIFLFVYLYMSERMRSCIHDRR
jgi:hypothetical protein